MIYERTDDEYRQLFSECDKDRDGYVTEAEILAILHEKNESVVNKMVHQIFLQCDEDDDGRLNYKGLNLITPV